MMKFTSEVSLPGRTALIISDLHSNLAALEATLAQRLDDEPIICAGDVVGYYSEPNECCDMIRASGAITVRGNHDAYVTGDLIPKPANRGKYRTDWTIKNLRPDNLQWLRSLPQTARIKAEGINITLRHANPIDEETYLYPDTDLTRYAQKEETLLVVGHTHHPMLRVAGKGRILNPGSVGQPRDRNPRAAFARINLFSGQIEFLRTDYNVLDYQKRLRAMGWDEETVALLSRT